MCAARIAPTIFIPNETNTLQNVYLERRHPQIEILWFHWPRDGIFDVPDYEPVIFIYSTKNELELVALRRGWEFEPEEPSNLYQPIEIVFGGIGGVFENATAGFHHPYFHYRGLDFNFNMQRLGKNQWNYQITPINNANEIPDVGRTGRGHPSLFLKKRRRADIDPFDWARAKLIEL